jgi:hypothetical protein
MWSPTRPHSHELTDFEHHEHSKAATDVTGLRSPLLANLVVAVPGQRAARAPTSSALRGE